VFYKTTGNSETKVNYNESLGKTAFGIPVNRSLIGSNLIVQVAALRIHGGSLKEEARSNPVTTGTCTIVKSVL